MADDDAAAEDDVDEDDTGAPVEVVLETVSR